MQPGFFLVLSERIGIPDSNQQPFFQMSHHIQIQISGAGEALQEILIAQLAGAGFEGFEQEGSVLRAFMPEELYDRDLASSITRAQGLSFTEKRIPQTNWNAVWESNFEPVRVDDFAGIRAEFHPPFTGVTHEILITPKMSFGTGHHATTFLMIRAMRSIQFSEKRVFDFGTGTGVLAILAEKLGAAEIVAVDNDEWSITNAAENLEANGCRRIFLHQDDKVPRGERFDIILANINKNVILDQLDSLFDVLSKDGTLLLSGLLEEDEAELRQALSRFSPKAVEKHAKNGWIALKIMY